MRRRRCAARLAATDDALCLPRITVGGDDVANLARKVCGEIDWHAHVREHVPRRLLRFVQ